MGQRNKKFMKGGENNLENLPKGQILGTLQDLERRCAREGRR